MTRTLNLAPWQIWVVDFGIPIGREQGGVRPAIVVGSSTHCAFPIDLALVLPLTTRDRGLRHHVRIASESSGLHHPSWARTEEIRTVSTTRFVQLAPIGTAAAAEIAELCKWLREMLAFSANRAA
jgi:mRNA interferase MazF